MTETQKHNNGTTPEQDSSHLSDVETQGYSGFLHSLARETGKETPKSVREAIKLALRKIDVAVAKCDKILGQ